MAKLSEKYPDDLDVTALYADSLMVLNPWVLWIKRPGNSSEIVPRDEKTLIAKAVLERVSQPPKHHRQPPRFINSSSRNVRALTPPA